MSRGRPPRRLEAPVRQLVDESFAARHTQMPPERPTLTSNLTSLRRSAGAYPDDRAAARWGGAGGIG
jgi:hypothetical protein